MSHVHIGKEHSRERGEKRPEVGGPGVSKDQPGDRGSGRRCVRMKESDHAAT